MSLTVVKSTFLRGRKRGTHTERFTRRSQRLTARRSLATLGPIIYFAGKRDIRPRGTFFSDPYTLADEKPRAVQDIKFRKNIPRRVDKKEGAKN